MKKTVPKKFAFKSRRWKMTRILESLFSEQINIIVFSFTFFLKKAFLIYWCYQYYLDAGSSYHAVRGCCIRESETTTRLARCRCILHVFRRANQQKRKKNTSSEILLLMTRQRVRIDLLGRRPLDAWGHHSTAKTRSVVWQWTSSSLYPVRKCRVTSGGGKLERFVDGEWW